MTAQSLGGFGAVPQTHNLPEIERQAILRMLEMVEESTSGAANALSFGPFSCLREQRWRRANLAFGRKILRFHRMGFCGLVQHSV